MTLSDFDPRPDASKLTAAKRRARPAQAETTPPIPWMPIGVVGCIVLLAIIFTRLPSVPTPKPLPTVAPAALSAPTSTPVRVQATEEPTAAPIATQEPAQQATGDDTGRGLTLYQDDVAPSATPEWQADPTNPAYVYPTADPAWLTATVVWPTSAPVDPTAFVAPRAASTCQFIGCLPGSALDRQAKEEPACHALFWQYGWGEVKEADRAAVAACIDAGVYR